MGKIGILGGTFDPVHFGHLSIAQCALEYFRLERMYFIPANVQPHKSGTTGSPVDRLEMLCRAVRDNPAFLVWSGEIDRGGYSYTADTLREFAGEHPNGDLHFIIGSDNLIELPKWKEFRTILERVTLCVARRPGGDTRIPDELIDANIEWFPSPNIDVSSTLIRSLVGRGFTCRYLLPNSVVDYIDQENIYRQAML